MPTSPTITNVSGNSFSVTVTPCDLDSDITIRDFLILENGILTPNPTSYSKTSQTTIQYAGPVLPSTTLEVRRFTPRGQRQIAGVGITKISSSVWNKEFDRRVRIQEEIDTYGAGGGFSVRLPIDGAYGVPWLGDTLFSPTRNSLYTKIETLAPLSNPTFTGNPAVPTQLTADDSTRVASTAYVKANLGAYAPLASPTFTGTPIVPTQLTSDSSTAVASTAYVKNNLTPYALNSTLSSYALLASPTFAGVPITPTVADGVRTTQIINALSLQRRSRPVVIASRTTSLVLTANTTTDINYNNSIRDASAAYNSATGIFTAPYTGIYDMRCTQAAGNTAMLLVEFLNINMSVTTRICQTLVPSAITITAIGSQLVFMNSGEQGKFRVRSLDAVGLLVEADTTNRSVSHMTINYIGIDTAS